MSTDPRRSVRDHLSQVVDRVESHHERVKITRNGRAVAVIISPEDMARLEESISVLNDAETLADNPRGDAAYAKGDVIRGVDTVRALCR